MHNLPWETNIHFPDQFLPNILRTYRLYIKCPEFFGNLLNFWFKSYKINFIKNNNVRYFVNKRQTVCNYPAVMCHLQLHLRFLFKYECIISGVETEYINQRATKDTALDKPLPSPNLVKTQSRSRCLEQQWPTVHNNNSPSSPLNKLNY